MDRLPVSATLASAPPCCGCCSAWPPGSPPPCARTPLLDRVLMVGAVGAASIPDYFTSMVLSTC